MPKSKKNKSPFPAKVTLSDIIGSRNAYHFIAVKSDLETHAISKRISELTRNDMSFIGDYKLEEANNNALFRMCYASLHYAFDINLVLLENKTTRLDQTFVAKSEQNQPFHTLSLFDDTYYIFNQNGLKLFSWDLLEIDYLMIIFANKEIPLDEILESLMQIDGCKCTNVTEEIINTGNQAQTAFVQKLLYKIDMEVSNFKKDRETHCFVSEKSFNEKNISFSKMELRLPANPLYLDYLKNDQTFM